MKKGKLLEPTWDTGVIITDIQLENIIDKKIKGLILDIDGTLLPTKTEKLTNNVVNWVNKAKKYFKIHLCTNNPSKKRVANIANQLDLDYTYRAYKPKRKKMQTVLINLGLETKSTAIIGDRIFTDILCGNRSGITTILVLPINKYGQIDRNKKRFQTIEKRISRVITRFTP